MVKLNQNAISANYANSDNHSPVVEYTNRLEIYSSEFINNEWTEKKAFVYNKADEYSVGQPALSPDGNLLYFVSDMPGGFGGSDIYYCEKIGKNIWGIPINAGYKINTEGNEVFPYLDAQGKLYFSSDGLPGMGDLDIFSVVGSKNTWENPINLKYPINSPKDDFSIYFTEPEKSGFLSSNRYGGKGSDDIYHFFKSSP
jgi:hypothetical protein